MKISVDISEPQKNGVFANINLAFKDKNGDTRKVPVAINFQPLNDFSKDLTSVAFDFFFVGSLVYCVDNLIERETYSVDGWAREIEVEFPVKNLSVWAAAKDEFQKILCFLTGDYWTISFSMMPVKNLFQELKGRWKNKIPLYNHDQYIFASLFSGGLDSLVGVINELEKLIGNEKGLFISHYDGTSPGTNSDQKRLISYLYKKYENSIGWVQEAVSLAPNDNVGVAVNREPSFRSRSLLFISIGVFCIENMKNCTSLIVPENGTISLNYPLTPSRSSTLSTRTTHPFYISSINKFLKALGITTEIINPYDDKTKGELVKACTNMAVLKKFYGQSVSCGKRGRKMNWDSKVGTRHCGVCMPCIYRRAALHKVGLDDQLYGIDIFTTSKKMSAIPDMPALRDFVTKTLTTQQIKRTLLVNGSFNAGELDKFAALVEDVREEILDWIKTKGNRAIKKYFELT